MFTKEQFEEWRLDKSNVQLNKLMIKNRVERKYNLCLIGIYKTEKKLML